MKVTELALQWGSHTPAEQVIFSFKDPRRLNPYNVKGMTGLDADEINPQYYIGSAFSNTKFHNMALVKREIVIRVELNPDFSDGKSYSDLRDDLYKIISTNRSGDIRVMAKNNGADVAYVMGHIIKLEAPQFNKIPEVQITIKCRDPIFRDVIQTVVDVSGFSESSATVTDDKSTAPHGFKFQINLLATRTRIKLFDPTDPSWALVATPYGGFLAGDQVHGSSEQDNKYLNLIRSGVTYPLAEVIAFASVFPLIFPGDNVFGLENPTSFNWISLTHYPSYWGI